MTEAYRVAVYAVPAAEAVTERAEAWLGRAVDGRPVPSEIADGWTRAEIDAITVDARRYGFHGTLKAPFPLGERYDLAQFDVAVAQLAAARPSVLIPRLTLTRLDGFFALVPDVESGAQPDRFALSSLADAAVVELDRFRAPMTDSERARRHPERLTEPQRELLDAWGYPYVLGEFRFHLTLTDRIHPARQDAVERTLARWFAPVLGSTVPIDSLAVFVEPHPGAPFVLRTLHPLTGSPAPLTTASATPHLEGHTR